MFQIHVMLEDPLVGDGRSSLMATLSSLDFSSCELVGFASAKSPASWVCSGSCYLGVLHEIYGHSESLGGF